MAALDPLAQSVRMVDIHPLLFPALPLYAIEPRWVVDPDFGSAVVVP